MKTVNSTQGIGEIRLVMEYNMSISNVCIDKGKNLYGSWMAMGLSNYDTPMFLILDDHDNAVFEVCLEQIMQYNQYKLPVTAKDDPEDKGILVVYEIRYFDRDENDIHCLNFEDAEISF